MKRIKKLFAILLVIVILTAALSACADRLSGTYAAMGITISFEKDGFTAEKGDVRVSGNYEITEDEEGVQRIYFTFAEGSGAYDSTFQGILTGKDGVLFEKHDTFLRISGIPFELKK